MNKVVVNDVFKAPDSGAPTFYLLPGIDGGGWFGMTGTPTGSTTAASSTRPK
jgi:hypothetical protein